MLGFFTEERLDNLEKSLRETQEFLNGYIERTHEYLIVVATTVNKLEEELKHLKERNDLYE